MVPINAVFGTANTNLSREIRKCKQCDASFHPTNFQVKTGKGVFCSRSCSAKWKNKNNNPTKDPISLQKMINTQKANLKLLFPNEEAMKEHFRSIGIKSLDKNRNNLANWVKKHPEEVKNRNIKYYQEHPEKHLNYILRRNKITSIEKATEDAISSLGLTSIWNKCVHLGSVFRFPDFQIVGTKIVVECLSNYWHNEEETLSRKQLFEKHGYICIFLYEKTIKSSKESIITALLECPQLKSLVKNEAK